MGGSPNVWEKIGIVFLPFPAFRTLAPLPAVTHAGPCLFAPVDRPPCTTLHAPFEYIVLILYTHRRSALHLIPTRRPTFWNVLTSSRHQCTALIVNLYVVPDTRATTFSSVCVHKTQKQHAIHWNIFFYQRVNIFVQSFHHRFKIYKIHHCSIFKSPF